ncbi:cornifelin isoform X2 [Brachionus plicatilis]|uniref:Cornifelin isoform X2 n=1 Tax=Brachionus plicatilis TaxID=10195 RepID=A0A3M7QTP4_BRAPC|nr:cornifelin isoform X2 [Brachionus plicatilis]
MEAIRTNYNYEQPHPGRVIVTEPKGNAWEYENEWTQTLFDCCTNAKICFCAFVCPWCFWCELFSRTGECLCTPIFVPLALLALRSKLRTGFRIKGTVANDCVLSTFCAPCVTLQL